MSVLNINVFREESSNSNFSWIKISNKRHWYKKYLRILRDYINHFQYLKENIWNRILYISKVLYISKSWNINLEERKWEWYMRFWIWNMSLGKKMRKKDQNWNWEKKIKL